jgi:hypothetical protein
MTTDIVERLRELLNTAELTQDQYETICDAIRALGGNP